ncbi:MAG: sporulation transcriptional regulator SpoIIID [Oscillospiraceae bacterium]|nr:sporulation transcriptional regulator SpoIIID [Oscillospiraceae bacterium]
MKRTVEKRATLLGEYIVENKTTVRKAAKLFGISKSTVHKDISERLRYVNPRLHKKVKVILGINKAQRHIRGGLATKRKYLNIHNI